MMLRWRGSADIKLAVSEHLESRDDLAGRVVVDVPAGRGRISALLAARGARVDALDLFPEFFEAHGLECRQADLNERLPLPDRHADIVLFQEAIEHLPDHERVLRELNRILKPGGSLILTTPNVSNLRARLSHLLVESELYNRLPAAELDAVWYSGEGKRYYGHLYLTGVQHLRALARLAGFRLRALHPVKVSASSVLLGPLYPALVATNLFAYFRTVRRNPGGDAAVARRALGEVFRLNLHPTVLFGKHLFLEFEKEQDWDRVEIRVNKDVRTVC